MLGPNLFLRQGVSYMILRPKNVSCKWPRQNLRAVNAEERFVLHVLPGFPFCGVPVSLPLPCVCVLFCFSLEKECYIRKRS